MPFYLVHIHVLTEVHLFVCPVLKPLLSTYVGHVADYYFFFNAWQLLAVRSLWCFYSGRGGETSLSPLSTGSAPPFTGSCIFFLSQGAYLCDKCVFPCGCLCKCWGLVYTVTLSSGGWELNWSGDSEADEVIPRSAPAGWENRHSGLWLSHRLVSPWQGTDMSVHICTT